MDAQQTLIIVLKALIGIKEALPKSMLINLLMGKEDKNIQERGLDETDAFGSGEGQDEDFWHNLLEVAQEAGFIKIKSTKLQTVAITPAGKKFLKKPVPFEIKDEEADFNGEIKDDSIDDIVSSALKDKNNAAQKSASSTRTRQQIKIIQAIDRKIALDDFAENEGMTIEDIIDELEGLVQMKMHIDISYFTNEILGKNSVDELMDFFDENQSDSIEDAMVEYGDVYSPEEIRLARIVYRCSKL